MAQVPLMCSVTKQQPVGGWTVFQKGKDGSVDFYRNWDDYKSGFGDLNVEFWLGLDKIHRLTIRGNNKLRVDLKDWAGNSAFAEYESFRIDDEASKYRLSHGSYSGISLVLEAINAE